MGLEVTAQGELVDRKLRGRRKSVQTREKQEDIAKKE